MSVLWPSEVEVALRGLSLIDAMRSYVRLVYSECMTYLCTYGNVQVAIFKKNGRLNGTGRVHLKIKNRSV